MNRKGNIVPEKVAFLVNEYSLLSPGASKREETGSYPEIKWSIHPQTL
jgi:hypothetical protein